MTSEEIKLIKGCRIMIVGKDEFIIYIKDELRDLGFADITDVGKSVVCNNGNTGIMINYIGEGSELSAVTADIPVIYSFDFISGAGAIVVFPADDRSWLEKDNLRLWAAEYISGYCAFWNIDRCEWLHDSLPMIKENRTNEKALKTAAFISARIAANIAVGRDVKRFPRFYIAENIEERGKKNHAEG